LTTKLDSEVYTWVGNICASLDLSWWILLNRLHSELIQPRMCVFTGCDSAHENRVNTHTLCFCQTLSHVLMTFKYICAFCPSTERVQSAAHRVQVR